MTRYEKAGFDQSRPDESQEARSTADVNQATRGVEIDPGDLSPAALKGVVEAFVNREGTDYGHRERSLEEKVADVMRQLAEGRARIVFDPESESVNILPVD